MNGKVCRTENMKCLIAIAVVIMIQNIGKVVMRPKKHLGSMVIFSCLVWVLKTHP